MDNNTNRKLGAGIITVSIIQLIIYVFALIGSIMLFVNKDTLSSQLAQAGMDTSLYTTSAIVISLVISVLVIISIALILAKKSLGVYLYIASIVINLAYTIITTGFTISIITSLILPALLIFFVYKKRDIFWGDLN